MDVLVTVAWLGLLLAAGWVFVVRPGRQHRRRVRQLQGALGVGDQVVTVGGIYGTVLRVDDDLVVIEPCEGVQLRIARRAIAGKVADAADAPDESEPLGDADQPPASEVADQA